MGSDITADEMATSSLSKGWNAVLTSETDKQWLLKLTPKPETETNYSYITIKVSKKYGGIEEIESFNSKGKLTKSQVRTNWQTFGVITIPTLFVYKDHQTGSKTELRFFGCKVNLGTPDSAFTKRSLMRGE
jgi:outer membrane lipoprotein-sorting protein